MLLPYLMQVRTEDYWVSEVSPLPLAQNILMEGGEINNFGRYYLAYLFILFLYVFSFFVYFFLSSFGRIVSII